jgi:hypothetical protein
MTPEQLKAQNVKNFASTNGVDIDKVGQEAFKAQDPITPPVPSVSYQPLVDQLSADQQRSQVVADKQQELLSQNSQDQSGLLDQLANKGTDQVAQEEQLGVPQLQKDAANYKSQLATLEASAMTMREQVTNNAQNTGRGAYDLNLIENGAQRSNLIERTITAAKLQATQGNIIEAQNNAQKAVDIKYAPMEKALEQKKVQYQENKQLLDRFDKKASDAYAQKIQAQEKQIALDKQNEKAISDVRLTLAQYGNLTPEISKALDGAKSVDEAISAAGQGLVDPKQKYELEGLRLSNQLKNAQIRTEQAQRNKINSEIQTAGAPLKGFSDYGAAPVGKKSQVLDAITKLKLNEGQANAASYSLRLIEANAALNRRMGDGTGNGTYDPTTNASAIGRIFRSDNARSNNRDLENFIRAQLRKESGATITPEELKGGKNIYSPEGIMTNQKDVAATKTTRQQAVDSMIAQAGPAGAYLKQYSEEISNGGLLPDEAEILYSVQPEKPALQADQIW